MKTIIGLLAAIALILVSGACSLIPTGGTSSTPAAGYPDTVVYKITLSKVTYLCTSFTVSNTDAAISLHLSDAYSLGSDGKVTWIGKTTDVAAVTVEKIK